MYMVCYLSKKKHQRLTSLVLNPALCAYIVIMYFSHPLRERGSPQTILYNHSHSGVCRCAVAAEFFGLASHKTLWLVVPYEYISFLQRTAISSELSGMFNSSSA